ncbi:MAG: 2OG-Fe(II) oxygenase family protein [Rhodospirillales bacterium]
MTKPPISTNPQSVPVFGQASLAEGNAESNKESLEHLQTGFELHQDGRIEEALALYHQILEQESENADAFYLAGVAYFQVHDYVQSELYLETALALEPGRSDILINLGNCRHAQSRLEEALEAYSQAITTDPNIAEAHNNYGNILRELGRFDEAESALRQALRLKPDHLPARSNLAGTLRSLGQLEDAEAEARKTLDLDPDFDPALTTLGRILLDGGKTDDAIEAFEKAMQLNPDDLSPHISLANIWHQRGDLEKSLSIFDSHLSQNPHETLVLSAKALLLNEIGGAGRAKALLDYERFIKPVKFDRAPNYESLDRFHTALRAHVEQLPDLTFEPLLKSTRQGYQAEQLERDESAPVEALKEIIAQGVEQYCAQCETISDHPLAPIPDDLSITIWVTILEGPGHQNPHIHPSAWLSGVYYVNLPEIMEKNKEGHAGWIEFGQPRDEDKYKAEPLLYTVQPEEGLMVMFPSYMFHRTIPVNDSPAQSSTDKRISIAFDVMAR